jgi:hypothetical protein
MIPLLTRLLLLGLATGTSLAAPAPGLPGDANGDGRLSHREWTDFLAQDVLGRVDADGDGFITEDEARRAAPLRRAATRRHGLTEVDFAAADRDGDGRLSRRELAAALAREKVPKLVFDDYDIDNDLHLKSWEMKEPPTNVGVRFMF